MNILIHIIISLLFLMLKFVSEAPGELGWVLTLIIVSFVSAVLGAIVMIIVLHCKR